MKRVLAPLSLVILAITMSISALAGATKDTVILYHTAQLNGTTIPAGEYKVTCETNGNTAQVKFMQGKKEIASATGQTKDLGKKTPSPRVVLLNADSGSATIQEVDLGGSRTGVVFNPTMANGGK